MAICLVIQAFGQNSYTPKIADPMLEEWRYAYFPELDDKGIRSIASTANSNEYWFGLDSGVMAYNGYDWTYYTENDGLTGAPVQHVFIDRNENVYAATSDGLFKFNQNRWENQLKINRSAAFDFKFIKQLTSGTLVCGLTDGVLFFYKNKSLLLTSVEKWRGLKGILPNTEYVKIPSKLLYEEGFDNFSDVFEVTEGQLWLAVTYLLEDEKGDIMIFSESEIINHKIENFNLLSKFYNIQLGYEQGIFRTSTDHIWIINKSNKLPALRFSNNRWETIEYGKQFGDDEYTESILESKDHKIWISGIGNLYCLDTNERWTKYSSETLNVPQAHVKLHLGAQSDLWIYGYQTAVYRVDLSQDKWLTYLELNYQCEQRDGSLWFLDFEGNVIFKKNDKWSKSTKKQDLMDSPVSLFSDSEDKVWAVGSHRGVASAGYFKNDKWVNFLFDSLSWGVDYRAIYESKDGSIWVGGCTDVYLEQGQTGGVVQIINPYSDHPIEVYHKARSNGLDQLNAYGISQTSDGKIWMGGSGLCYYDGKSWNNLDDADLNDFVNDVHNDQNGVLYVASRQHGLYLNNSGKWVNYSIQNGLNSNNIISIATSQVKDEIWLATDKNFSFFNGEVWVNNIFPEQLTFSYEGGSIQLNGRNEIWISRSLREWKRRVYTGKSPNLSIKKKYNSYRFIKDTIPPQTSIEVFSKTVDESGNTTMFWSGRHYFNKISADKLLFSYRLNEGEWSKFSNRLNHTFTDLDNGNHTFHVKSMDTEGNIDPSPATVAFTVTPPVWKQTWFVLLITSFIIVLGYFQYLIIKKRKVLQKLNESLQGANSELEAKNIEVQTQKESLEVAVKKIDELSRAKMKFFTNITHEFRTPLSLILGPIEKLSKDAPQDTTLHNFYGLIKKNALRLQKLINQLLEVRRIESGNFELQLTKKDIVKFASDIKVLFDNQAIENSINYTFHSDFDKLTIYFDPDKVEKILFNLLSNAFKHTDSKQSIQISLLRAENYLMKDNDLVFVRLVVEDTGTGIEDSILNNLFERFSVGHNELDQGEHSGIGLSYIKDLIEAHQGNIKVESEPDQGTKFTVYIPENIKLESSEDPVAVDEDYDPKYSLDASILTAESKWFDTGAIQNTDDDRPTILVVEDNLDMGYFIQSLLSTDYKVLSAENGEEGMKVLETEYIDLIISDIMMPKVDGITFCQSTKSNPAVSHIPIILLTALHVDEKRIKGYESGADSYIVKPFKSELLVARVENLLSSREALKEIFAGDLRFKPKDVKVTSVDEEFLTNLSTYMEENISDSQFDVSKMCKMANMSHMHFIRKVKQLTGKKPIDLLKSFRLSRAKQLLEQNKINISEIGYMVGYDLPNSFTRAFKNEFGISPTQFANNGKSSK